jgi:putative ABC transport system permease protein
MAEESTRMRMHPIILEMRANKGGALLIALQVAITVAILCNGLFIVEQRLALSRRPTGTDEAHILAVANQWVGNPTDLAARLHTDLAALRAIPGVVDAYASNTFPLNNTGSTGAISLQPDQAHSAARVATYLVDEHALGTLGLRLIAGRNFTVEEVAEPSQQARDFSAGIIITDELSHKLFPNGDALGKAVYLEYHGPPTPIIGIVKKLQIPWTRFGEWGSGFYDNSVLKPVRYVNKESFYLIRVRPHQLEDVRRRVPAILFDIRRDRVLERLQSLQEARQEAYRGDRGLAILMGAVSIALLSVTAFGIIGLTRYWVSQRRRQIGIRRALGASRPAILRYFHVENLIIAGAGAVVGIGLGICLNLWMVGRFEMARLSTSYLFMGALVALLVGQVAVLWPALRASIIPPAVAARG